MAKFKSIIIHKKLAAIILSAVNVAGTLPWVYAEMAESRAKWPRLVSDVTFFLVVIGGLLLLCRWKKKRASDEKGDQTE